MGSLPEVSLYMSLMVVVERMVRGAQLILPVSPLLGLLRVACLVKVVLEKEKMLCLGK